jgi:regulator of replication initiation timing
MQRSGHVRRITPGRPLGIRRHTGHPSRQVLMRRRRSLVISALTVALGACAIFVGSLVRGNYAPQVWLDIGAALVLFGPLYWIQSMLERGLREVRRHEQDTRSSVEQLSQEIDSSVEQLSHEIEAIRQETTASLDDLRQLTLEKVEERRRTDEDAFRRFEEAPTFQSVVELLDMARDLGAVSERGVRVRLPATSFRLRFPLSTRLDNGGFPVLDVGIEEEDGTLPHDATTAPIAMRGQQPVPWSAGTSADAWAASVAPELQKLNRYPGDDQFDPAGSLRQLTTLLRVAVEARTRPPSASTPRLRPIIEMPNDEWVITEDGLQSPTSETGFTVKELFGEATEEAATAELPPDRAAKLREAWRIARSLFLSPGSPS